MIEQILLSSSRFEGVRETGGFGQPLHALYPQIRAVLAHDVEPDAAFLLAEPVVDRAKNRIDWYTEGDPDDAPVALSSLPDAQQQATLARIDDLLGRSRALAEQYVASDDARKAQVGAVLRAVLVNPAQDAIFLVQGRPVMTGWGFEPDRPWIAPDGSGEGSPTPKQPLGASSGMRDSLVPEVAMPSTEAVQRDVVMPEVAIPELATSVPEATPVSSVSPSEPKPHLEEAAPPASSAPVPSKTPLESTSSEPVATGAHRLESRREPLESASKRPAAASSTLGEPPGVPPASASLLRYVVVGSHYFWGVVLLAVVLLLLAAYWGLGRKPVSAADVTDPLTRSAADGTMAGALRDAQQMEGDLREQLERLLVQVAERRGQCVLPQGGSAGAVIPEGATSTSGGAAAVPSLPTGRAQGVPPPAVGETGKTTPSTPTISSTPSTPQTTERLRPENAPRGQQPAGATPSATGVAPPDADSAVGTKAIPGTSAVPGTGTPSMTGTSPEVNPTRRAPATPGAEANPTPTGSAADVSTPSAPPLATPGAGVTKTDKTEPAKTDAAKAPTSSSATASSPRSASGEPAGRTLEDSLMEQGGVKTPSSPQTPPVTPPTKAEPTADERKEFANRMSETGATSGETTVTLLWNSHADLDLVVRCPSGQQLDFRNPAECGGTLDVDANATRNSLSERPVENAFWPASKAAPGAYEIAVRYVPRKDEERSQATSYQVRLSRGGQESVFKGTIQPHAVVPITTFTVKR